MMNESQLFQLRSSLRTSPGGPDDLARTGLFTGVKPPWDEFGVLARIFEVVNSGTFFAVRNSETWVYRRGRLSNAVGGCT